MKLFHSILSSNLNLPVDTYIYKITQSQKSLAVISSDDSLSWVDPATLEAQSCVTSHQGVTCLESYDSSQGILSTCGRDAKTSIWDLRLGNGAKVLSLNRPGFDHDLLSLACNASSHLLATGAEYSPRGDAFLTIWDTRNPATPFRVYSESHSDDITSLQFHPTSPSILLSGSTDGLVNTYNLDISDEDEAVIKTFNHGSSIHHARFLTPSSIAALSHDETLTIYDNTIAGASPSSNVTDIVFKDLRPILKCEYIVDIILPPFPISPGSEANLPTLAAGNTITQTLTIHPVLPLPNPANTDFPKWFLKSNPSPAANGVLDLKGGHELEVVRTVSMDSYLSSDVIFTGGEDGSIKAWRSDPTSTSSSDRDEDEDEDEDMDDIHNTSRKAIQGKTQRGEKTPKGARDDRRTSSSINKSERYRPY